MMKSVTIDSQAYICPSWQEMGEMTVSLSQKIQKSGQKFDRLIALAKGGWGWARQLQDLLRIETQSSIQISFYKGIMKTKRVPVVIQSLPISILGEKVLVYDDVVDSGETLELAKQYLLTHGAREVVSASHYIKSWTKTKPDYWVKETKAWILFPHDVVENMDLIVKKWGNVGKKELAVRFGRLGIEKTIIDFYLA